MSSLPRLQDSPLSIGADVPGTDALVRHIREKVEEGRREGRYDEDIVTRAERHNLFTMRDRPDFVRRYLACVRQASLVDINDFAIVERRKRFGRTLVLFKRSIWKILRFYTYRLWSQQNQVNGVLLAALEMIEDRHRERIESLEARVRDLEQRSAAPSPCSPPMPEVAAGHAQEGAK